MIENARCFPVKDEPDHHPALDLFYIEDHDLIDMVSDFTRSVRDNSGEVKNDRSGEDRVDPD